METVFLTYANSPSDPLANLRKEEEEVYSLLSRRSARQDFALHKDGNATLPKVAEYLVRFRESLSVFCFSGHAERDALLLEDQTANALGIAELLGQCPRLRLVLLNGCSTKGQVAKLLALPNHPVVMATSAPVSDPTATQFAISFFQAFSEQSATIGEAFAIGLAAAKAVAEHPLPLFAERGIGLLSNSATSKEPLWGLYTPEGYETRLNGKLHQSYWGTQSRTVTPNQFLIKGLLKSLALYDPEVNKVQKAKQQSMMIPGMKNNANERVQKNVILRCLPFPISVHLQKLLAKKRASMAGHDFYDEFGIKRLKQLLHTYNTVIELPAFVMLAQLWDALSEKKPVAIDEIQRQVIQDYLQAPDNQRIKNIYAPLMKSIADILQTNKIPFFVKELAAIRWEKDTELHNACMTLELKKERITNNYPFTEEELAAECVEAEEKLTAVLGSLSFLAGYSLVSVRNIDVLHNRQIRTPNYLHRLVRLVQHFSEDPTEEIELLEEFLDNASVLMMRKEVEDPQARFLNLTPFVIDENAYVEKAEDHKLFYFLRHEVQRDAYFFKHIYKPEDHPMAIEAETRLEPLMHQFRVFWQLLNDSMVEAS